MPIATTLMVAAALAGCANPPPDVRLALCKDLVVVELGAVPDWQGSEVQTRGYRGAFVTLRFATAQGDQRATCEYRYDAVDDTALTLANPLAAYATSPSRMTIDERTLTGPELARAVQRAMQRQGREFIDRTREALRGQ